MLPLNIVYIFLLLFISALLPAAGIIFSGTDLARYLGFPPQTGYVRHEPFSLPVFIVILSIILIPVIPVAVHIIKQNKNGIKITVLNNPFPWWGYAGIITGLMSWIIAWTRIPLFEPVQRWTFLPLWLSFIITVNALCVKRRNYSLLTHCPRYFLLLFPSSAVFWWLFEYLNRFTSNWNYTGTGSLSPARYFTEATLAFSTVLPAVMSTGELLKGFPSLYAGMNSFIKIKCSKPRMAAIIILLLSGAGLALTGIFPEWLFPMLWVSPLLVIVSIQAIAGNESIFNGISSGDWRPVAVYSLSALMCGFFWEMWNMFSMAKWIYSIPYVHVFKIFEMPVLGYAGYLPFGLECAVVSGMISGRGKEPWRML